jgi:basic membrane protein A
MIADLRDHIDNDRSTMRTRTRIVGLVAALALVGAACGGDDTDEADADTSGDGDAGRVAMILPGPISDADYNAVAYEALGLTGEEVGVETAYTDAVSVADAERVASDYAADGFDIVILHGAQFGTVAATLAPSHPDTTFIIQSSGEQDSLPDNVYNLARTYVPGFYLLGRLAASTSTSGTIAFLGGLDIPDFKGGANAVYEGAVSVNPDIRMQVTFTGDQNDPVRGGQPRRP